MVMVVDMTTSVPEAMTSVMVAVADGEETSKPKKLRTWPTAPTYLPIKFVIFKAAQKQPNGCYHHIGVLCAILNNLFC